MKIPIIHGENALIPINELPWQLKHENNYYSF